MLPETFTPSFLRQLELFKLQSRRAFLGSKQGGHISLRKGHGIEFSDYRTYELGDSPRHIDWNLYARTDRLYVKRFQEEEDITALVVLDTSASMTTPSTDRKWEMARDIAIALSYIALMEQDTVHISALGYFNSPAYYGARAIHSLSRDLLNLTVGAPREFRREISRALSKIRFPGVAVIISDFLWPFEEVQGVVNAMRARNLQINAIQLLGPSDLSPLEGVDAATVVDSETGEEIELDLGSRQREEYQAGLKAHTKMLREFFYGAGVSFIQAETSRGLEDFVIEELPRLGLLK